MGEPTVNRTRLRELEADFKRGRLPEQKTAPRHYKCDTCKGKGFREPKGKPRKTCLVCNGRGLVFDAS
jgi:DnaJ-class molecular chaperone